MNCYDCAAHDTTRPAVAVCHDCGAGICTDHAVSRDRHLTRTISLGMPIPVDPPARTIRCSTCTKAIDARYDATHHGRRTASPTPTAS